MKTPALESTSNPFFPDSLPSPLRPHFSFSHQNRLKKRRNGMKYWVKPCMRVFFPLSGAETIRMEALLSSLEQVDQRLEAEVSPGHPEERWNSGVVLLKRPSVGASLCLRRKKTADLVKVVG